MGFWTHCFVTSKRFYSVFSIRNLSEHKSLGLSSWILVCFRMGFFGLLEEIILCFWKTCFLVSKRNYFGLPIGIIFLESFLATERNGIGLPKRILLDFRLLFSGLLDGSFLGLFNRIVNGTILDFKKNPSYFRTESIRGSKINSFGPSNRILFVSQRETILNRITLCFQKQLFWTSNGFILGFWKNLF